MSQSEAQLLRELQDSILFESGFPNRVSRAHEEVKKGPKEDSDAKDRPELRAIELGRNFVTHLEGIVRKLGAARYEPAIPTLAQLWRECALVPVRIAVGHALFAMHTEDARYALESMIEDSDHLSLFLGVRAVFDRDPDRAYDYFELRFRDARSSSLAVVQQALALLAPSRMSFKDGRVIPLWTEPRAPSWLKADPRWLDLCARLRRDEVFGEIARTVLKYADPNDRDSALSRIQQAEVPQKVEWYSKRSGDLFARYRSGQFEAVWREIRLHRRIAGDFREEILEVAEETMRRVARNADLISERLRAKGWRALNGELRPEPASGDAAVFERIEAITRSPVPPSLLAFWRIVGGIDWVWNYRSEESLPDLDVDLPMDEMDPLCVDPAKAIEYLFEEWEEQRNQPDPDLVGPFRLWLAPDYLHKANISGGAPYGIELPSFEADPLFAYERHELPFIDYLRLSFRWVGFPGLDEHGDRDDVQRFVKAFGQGIEPF